VIGTETDAFARDDYRTDSNREELGANPWHSVLIVISGTALGYFALRGERSARLPAALAVGLSLGFLAFSATAQWSVYVSRYQIPLLVLWAPLIAIALDRISRWALRAVVAALVLAVTPQLLDNGARPLLHDVERDGSDLGPYFFFGDDHPAFLGPSEYEAARDAIVESGCERLGIANWVLLEYPLWVGLDNADWNGDIAHVNVDNASSALADGDFQPCALIQQQSGRDVQTPTGWVSVPFGRLSVAFAPEFRDRVVSVTDAPEDS
jgi:hypothetical protein